MTCATQSLNLIPMLQEEGAQVKAYGTRKVVLADWCALWKLVKNGLMSELSSLSGMSSVLSASDQARAVWA